LLISIPFGAIKSYWQPCSGCHIDISIPFGAIKSRIKKLESDPEAISIPFGAIKRALPGDVFDIELKFQFLLVRLKDEPGCLFPTPKINFNSFWCD